MKEEEEEEGEMTYYEYDYDMDERAAEQERRQIVHSFIPYVGIITWEEVHQRCLMLSLCAK